MPSFMWRCLMMAFICGTVLFGCGPKRIPGPLTLIENGKTGYQIVRADNPIPSEQYAVQELQNFLEQITGAKVPVAQPGKMPRRAIFVGRSEALEKVLPGMPWEAMGREGFIIRTVGPHLILAGGRPRGTLYAVYTFLDEQLGCRWFTTDCSLIPKREAIVIPQLNQTRMPVLEYRETFIYPAFDGDWCARNRNNSSAARLTEKHGGKVIYTGFVHTFYTFLPPAKYFKDHPDWYSERGGKRFFERGQLCLTNPQVVHAMTEAVREQLKAHPETAIISISQNDWHGWCECANCKKVEEEEGAHSGPIIRFVNQIAENLEKEFPNVAFDTLAYSYSRKPPLKAKPRHNVIVRLCSIECCFSHPLESCPENASFRDDIIAWSKICNRLYIWDYVTDFAHYLLPFPNLDVLAANIRFFIKHGVKGIFEEGQYQTFGGELDELRAYMLARLLWNPDYDPQALMDEFLTNYYGPAAEPIRKYIRLMHDKVRKENIHVRCFIQPNSPLYSPENIAQADALFNEAEKLAANDPTILKRVQIARLPIMYVQLVRGRAWARQAARAGQKFTYDERTLTEKFLATAEAAKLTFIREGARFEPFMQGLKERLAARRATPAPPPGMEKLPADKVLDIQDDEFTLYREGTLTKLKAVEDASDGMAAWMTGATKEWAIQHQIDVGAFKPGKRYDAFAVVKAVKKGKEGNAFAAGIYDVEKKKGLGAITVKAADLPDGWQSYKLGTFLPEGRQYLWVAGCENAANVPDIYVDRFYFVEAP